MEESVEMKHGKRGDFIMGNQIHFKENECQKCREQLIKLKEQYVIEQPKFQNLESTGVFMEEINSIGDTYQQIHKSFLELLEVTQSFIEHICEEFSEINSVSTDAADDN